MDPFPPDERPEDLPPAPSSSEVAAHQARADLGDNVAQVGALVDQLVAADPSGRWLLAFIDVDFVDPRTADVIAPLLRQLYAVVKNADINLNRLSAVVRADEKLTRFWSAPGFTALETYPPAEDEDGA